jgi:hypothetical protein
MVRRSTPTLERMDHYPTRLHVVSGLFSCAGLILALGSAALLSERFRTIGLLMFLAGACGFCAAETRYLLKYRHGASMINNHISEAKNPFSFKLHIGLQVFFIVFWALAFVMGLSEVLK